MPDASTKHYFAFEVPELSAFKRAVQEDVARVLGIQPNKSRTPAHVTIKYRLELTKRDAAAACAHMSAYVRNRKLLPIDVRVAGLGAFEDSRTLYVALDGAFVKAWRELVDEFTALGYPKQKFEGSTPHVTLFSDLKVRQFPRVQRYLVARSDFPTGTFSARQLVLYRKVPTEDETYRWEPAHTLQF